MSRDEHGGFVDLAPRPARLDFEGPFEVAVSVDRAVVVAEAGAPDELDPELAAVQSRKPGRDRTLT